jgi:hypothetical protein
LRRRCFEPKCLRDRLVGPIALAAVTVTTSRSCDGQPSCGWQVRSAAHHDPERGRFGLSLGGRF